MRPIVRQNRAVEFASRIAGGTVAFKRFRARTRRWPDSTTTCDRDCRMTMNLPEITEELKFLAGGVVKNLPLKRAHFQNFRN